MIILDLETTGLSITSDRIVQIAMIKGDVEKKTLVNPEMPIPAEATAVHGITNEMVKDAPTFKQLSKSILAFIDNEDLAGYNSDAYDIPLLIEEFERVGLTLDMNDRKTIDAYRNECAINKRDLSTVYHRMTGKVLDDAHDALADTRATKEILELQLSNPEYVKKIEEAEAEGLAYVDFTKKIYENEEGELCWAFGKNKDAPIHHDRSYCNWVLRGEFTKQVKDLVRSVIDA